MKTRARLAAAGAAALLAATALTAPTALAEPTAPPAQSQTKGPPAHAKGTPNGPSLSIQMLSFNDYHGHLEAAHPPIAARYDPSQTPVGGAEYLATTLSNLRATAPNGNTITVAAGDLIGGSPFLSGLFHDRQR